MSAIMVLVFLLGLEVGLVVAGLLALRMLSKIRERLEKLCGNAPHLPYKVKANQIAPALRGVSKPSRLLKIS